MGVLWCFCGYEPAGCPLTYVHLRAESAGQVYLPEVNYVMMVLTVIVVAIFKTTTILGNAYGGPAPALQGFASNSVVRPADVEPRQCAAAAR